MTRSSLSLLAPHLAHPRLRPTSGRFALSRLLTVCGLLTGATVGFMSSAQAQFAAPADLVTVPAAPAVALKVGATTPAKVTLKIKDGFHIQANPASEEYLIPTTLTLTPALGIKVGKPVYPAPLSLKTKLSANPLKVYEGTPSITVPVTVPAGTKPGEYTLKGEVEFQACNDTQCFPPGEAVVALKIQVGGTAAPKSGTGTTGTNTNGTGTTSTGAVAGTASPTSGPTGTSATVSSENVTSAQKAADAQHLSSQFNVASLPTVIFLGANGQERADLRLGEGTAELLTLDGMNTRLNALKSGETFTGGGNSWADRFKSSSLPLQLVLAFIGGLLLNLTPCVYPMIPITVGYFGSQSDGRMSRTVSLALCYMLGLAIVYSALGVFASLTGSLFGAALQSRWVTGGVALVLATFALSMFGLFTIQPPSWMMSRGGAKKGALGALGMGAMLGVVAAPCVGPALGALIAYVGTQGQVLLGFALFFALSVGLGLPYVLLGTFSGSVKSLPRSGKWMEKSKYVFGALFLVAASYYGYMAVKPAPTQAATQQSSGDQWQPATLMAINAAKASGKPVVLDFRADWCIPCHQLEKDVFTKPEMLAKAGGVTLLKVDMTSKTG